MKTTKRTTQRNGKVSTPRPIDVDAIRVQAIQDTIRAVIQEVEWGGDAFTDTPEMRAIAKRLGVPFYVVALAEQSTMSPDSRMVSEADIDEWRAWQQRHQ